MPSISLDKLQHVYVCSIIINKHRVSLINHGVVDKSKLQKLLAPWATIYDRFIGQIPPSTLLLINHLNSTPILLVETAWFYALNVKLSIENAWLPLGKTPSKWDYPACINICISRNNTKWLAFELSSVEYTKKFHRILLNEFNTQFSKGVGERPNPIPNCQDVSCKKYPSHNDCRNTIGNCAEQRAANDIFSYPASRALRITDIDFSPALRPRTLEIIPPCCNCKALFPQLS